MQSSEADFCVRRRVPPEGDRSARAKSDIGQMRVVTIGVTEGYSFLTNSSLWRVTKVQASVFQPK